MSDPNHIRQLIIKHTRRLQKLREQQATFGLYTPPYILIEIEDTEQQIERLRQDLDSQEPPLQDSTQRSQPNHIGWEMRYALPNQTYLEFVTRYILQRDLANLVDPFSLQSPSDIHLDEIYVIRERVEAEISRPGPRVILGPEGRGKTILFRKLPQLLGQHILIVKLPLARMSLNLSKQQLKRGKTSLLAVNVLTEYIFDAYWQSLFQDPIRFAKFYPVLRRDAWWRSTLRQFYRHYPPQNPELEDQFELIGWLKFSPLENSARSKRAAQEIFQDLVRLVTFTPVQGLEPLAPRQPYTHIQILVDDVDNPEYLTIPAARQLFNDVQKLYEVYNGQVQFKLFINSNWKNELETINSVKLGRVEVYHLPPWQEQELRRLLLARLKAYQLGEFANDGSDQNYEWGRLIPESHLLPAAQARLVEMIIQSTLDWQNSNLDAPIHVLRLARALVAACAGCWEIYGYKPPLSVEEVKTLTNLYWNVEGVEK